jgi:hypothetical protein
LAQDVLWSPLVDPAVLLFRPTPDFLSPVGGISIEHFSAGQQSSDGYHAIDRSPACGQLLFLHGYSADRPPAALIPVDTDMAGRLEALSRFWRAVQRRSIPADTRMTLQRRSRLRLMMRAVDGRGNGASYREVAIALYGRTRVAADPWKTSALRDAVIALAEGGLALIGGGYLQLLRHRRKA